MAWRAVGRSSGPAVGQSDGRLVGRLVKRSAVGCLVGVVSWWAGRLLVGRAVGRSGRQETGHVFTRAGSYRRKVSVIDGT